MEMCKILMEKSTTFPQEFYTLPQSASAVQVSSGKGNVLACRIESPDGNDGKS